MMKFRVSLILLPIIMSLQSLAFAAPADKAGLTSELQVWNVVRQDNGSEALNPARTVKPGDVLEYTVTYKNAGDRAVSRLVASLPIPAGTELVDASAVPRDVQASIDGKVYAAVPLMRKARRADGQMVDVPIPMAEYRFVRWPEHQVAAGASFTTSARVRVVSASASVAASATARSVPTSAATSAVR